MSRLVSQKELAELLGLSPRQIRNLERDGMPKEASGYPIPAAVRWYVTTKAQAAADKARPTSVEESELRLSAAQAETAELKLAELRKQLMTVEDGERYMADLLARVDARIKNLPQRIAAIAWSADMTERVRQAAPLVDEVRAELYEADDIPTEEAA